LGRIACGDACCDTSFQVCLGSGCCSTAYVNGDECCQFTPPCHGKCCAADENCFSIGGGPEQCNKLTPVNG
jgi:hypothetical protein